MNAIIHAAVEGVSLKDSIVYVTGIPCKNCLISLKQAKVKKVVYGPLSSVMTNYKDNTDDYVKILTGGDMKVKKFSYLKELVLLNSRVADIIKDRKEIDFEWN
jgi:deoxycytidylate deaminase